MWKAGFGIILIVVALAGCNRVEPVGREISEVAVAETVTDTNGDAEWDALLHADPNQLVAKLERVVREEPGNAWAWEMLGRGYGTLKRYEDGLRTSQQALALDPNRARSWHVAGGCYWQGKNDPESALRCTNRAIELDPNFVDAYFVRGSIWLEQGDTKKAWQEAEAISALEPKSPQEIQNKNDRVYTLRGNVYMMAGQVEEALSCFNSVPVERRNIAVWYGLGWGYKQKGALIQAREALTEVLAQESGVARIWLERSEVNRNLGYDQEAEADFQKALALDMLYVRKWAEAKQKIADALCGRPATPGLPGLNPIATSPLDVVELSARSMRDDEVAHLARYRNLKQITFYAGCAQERLALSDQGLMELSGLELPIERIELGWSNWITDAGVSRLAAMERLRWLDLRYLPGVSDRGVEALARAGRIETLDLRGCPRITDRGLAQLAACESIRQLMIGTDAELCRDDQVERINQVEAWRQNQITPQGVKALGQLPTLQKLVVGIKDDGKMWSPAMCREVLNAFYDPAEVHIHVQDCQNPNGQDFVCYNNLRGQECSQFGGFDRYRDHSYIPWETCRAKGFNEQNSP